MMFGVSFHRITEGLRCISTVIEGKSMNSQGADFYRLMADGGWLDILRQYTVIR